MIEQHWGTSMCLRAVLHTILPVLLLAIAPVSMQRGDRVFVGPPPMACHSGSPRIDAKRAAELSEKEIIDFLASPEVNKDETAHLLESLGRFDRSNTAVAELIRWIEFEYWGGKQVIWNTEVPLIPQPAAESLKRIGAFAVPQLVDEYVFFFENTSLEARADRYCQMQVDRHFNILPVQSPRYRLASIGLVLLHSPDMDACSVECAWNHMATKPDDDRVHRACRDLCKGLAQYHWEERTKFFECFSRNADETILTRDRVAVAELLDTFHEDEERTERIAKLTQFKYSPIVISELVHWLEFKPNLKSTPKPAPGEKHHGHEEYPCAVVLEEFGPAAATQLVGDYLFYFENTDIDNNRKRMFRREQNDDKGRSLEQQDPSPRLKLIATVLALTPETARKAVDYAIKRSGTPEADARVQRGCGALIDEIVSQFPKADRADIFPQSVLGR